MTLTIRPTLLCLSGLPGSGKTKVAKEWLAEDSDGRIRVNYDEMRLARFGPAWKWNRKGEEEIKAAARRTIEDALKAGLSVCIDNTNLSRGVRAGWEQLARSCGADYVQQEIDTPISICLARDRGRKDRAGGRVGQAVIERMALFYGFLDWTASKEPIVIVDIDGTVADCSHRLHHIKPLIVHKMDCKWEAAKRINATHTQGRDDTKSCPQCGAVRPSKDWPSFFASVSDDKPNAPIIALVRRLYIDHQIIMVSGRDTSIGIETEEWLFKHHVPFHRLFLRQAGDHRPDTDAKREIIEHLPLERVKYVFEDRSKVVEMYRSLGLTVLQVAEGSY